MFAFVLCCLAVNTQTVDAAFIVAEQNSEQSVWIHCLPVSVDDLLTKDRSSLNTNPERTGSSGRSRDDQPVPQSPVNPDESLDSTFEKALGAERTGSTGTSRESSNGPLTGDVLLDLPERFENVVVIWLRSVEVLRIPAAPPLERLRPPTAICA